MSNFILYKIDVLFFMSKQMNNSDIFKIEKISAPEKLVLLWLNEQKQPVVATNKHIAQCLSYESRNVFKYILSLQKKGFIRKNIGAGKLKHYSRCNTYDVLK